MGWLNGWVYRKPVTIDATSTDQTNLTIKHSVSWLSGKMQSDFADIRFTDNDGETLLNQFQESYISETSSVWYYTIPSKPTAGKTIYMYYGNPGASLLSNASDTFEFYDDFTGTDNDPPDATKWTISDNTYVKISNNHLRMIIAAGNLQQYCRSLSSVGVGYAVKFRFKKETGGTGRVQCGVGDDYDYRTDNISPDWEYFGVTTSATAHGDGVYHTIEIKRIDAQLVRYFFDNVEGWSRDTSTDSTNKEISFYYTGANFSDAFWCNWVFRYKLPDDGTEMSDPAEGSEETQSASGRYFSGKDGKCYASVADIPIIGWSFIARNIILDVTDSSSSDAKERLLKGLTKVRGKFVGFLIDGDTGPAKGSTITLKLDADEYNYFEINGIIRRTETNLGVYTDQAVLNTYEFQGTGELVETL